MFINYDPMPLVSALISYDVEPNLETLASDLQLADMTIPTDVARRLFKALGPHFIGNYKKTTHLDGCTVQATLGYQVLDGWSERVFQTNIMFTINGNEATISN